MSDQATPASVDLTNCDREPIHVPAQIQPHGVLLVLREPHLEIVQASENVGGYFGRSAGEIVGEPLSTLLDATSVEVIRTAIANGQWEYVNPLRLDSHDRLFDGIIHRHDGALILELEVTSAAVRQGSGHHPLRPALMALQHARTVMDLCETAVREVRRLTSFERVMLYRFHEGGDGSVEAESKVAALEPYLGLRYPATDIPQQARQLYLKNWLRIIPDALYTPAPLIPPMRTDTGAALDLSFAVLRSVSPIHLEYMANMGVRASMSISLVVRGKLWGLISCANHSGPRTVPYELRSACEVLGRLTSLQIAAVQEREALALRASRQTARNELTLGMRSGDILEGMLSKPDQLLSLVAAEGAAIVRGSECRTCGVTPTTAAISDLSNWLDEGGHLASYATSRLSSVFASGAAYSDVASGIATFALPGLPGRRVIWFRPEIIKNVHWGGNPGKPAAADPSLRVHPRKSFEAWKEEVRWTSAAWTASDVEAVEELRRDALELDLERQVLREQRAVRARDDLVAVVSHDLRNPLGVIQMQAAILLQAASGENEEFSRRVQTSAEHIQRSVARMNTLIGDLLDLARLEAGRFTLQCRAHEMSELIGESLVILRPLAEQKRIDLTSDLRCAAVNADRDRIFQVLSNLVGNAIKFTPAGGRIDLRCEEMNGEVQVTVADTGPGIAPEQLSNVFDRYWQARPDDLQGSGLGLFIAKGIVEAHGGRIWAQARPGSGATFVFTLPSEPSTA
jgi:chemotaxis family two-component system sensor kinase Cph1